MHRIFLNLPTQQGNDLLLPMIYFLKEHASKNTLNLKNRASLPNKATVSVSPKILQLDL